MKGFPIPDQHLGQPGEAYGFQHLIWGYAVTGLLIAAVELDLFTLLHAGPATLPEVATACGAQETWTEKLLTACAGLGLLQREGETFRNTPFATGFLVRGQPAYQGEIILHLRHWERWQELAARARAGGPVRRAERPRAEQTPEERQVEHRTWIMGMHNIAMAGQAAALVGALNLTGRRHLLDVGGGPGTYAAFLCRENPDLHATVIDLAQTEPITREIIHSFGLEERVGFRSGDFLRDSYGEGNDVVLLSGVLHGQPASDCLLMLKKAHEALAPGGLVAVQELLLTEQKDGPLLPALFSLHMTRGAAYTGSEIAGWMGSAGFTGTEVRHLSGYSWMNGLVLGRKAG